MMPSPPGLSLSAKVRRARNDQSRIGRDVTTITSPSLPNYVLRTLRVVWTEFCRRLRGMIR
jgi:hypothetical protein